MPAAGRAAGGGGGRAADRVDSAEQAGAQRAGVHAVRAAAGEGPRGGGAGGKHAAARCPDPSSVGAFVRSVVLSLIKATFTV